jgi:hypothetical protein
MARPPRYKPRDSSRRRAWILLGVAAFVFVDVILIGWALGTRNVDTPSESRPIPTFTPSQASTTAPAAPVATVAIRSTRLLSALDGDIAWRATTGECPAATASPEKTSDAGQTWNATDATRDVRVTALRSLLVVSESQIEAVGLAAEDCAPQFIRSFVSGDEYSSNPDLLDAQWYIDPLDRSVVNTPDGESAAPCGDVVALAPRADAVSAAIICADTRILTTADSGRTWREAIRVAGVVNVAVTQMGYVIATVGLPECAGVQLTALSVDPIVATPTSCLPVDMQAETMQGNVAISEAAGAVWVWAGDSLKRSIDQGLSWQ